MRNGLVERSEASERAKRGGNGGGGGKSLRRRWLEVGGADIWLSAGAVGSRSSARQHFAHRSLYATLPHSFSSFLTFFLTRLSTPLTRSF